MKSPKNILPTMMAIILFIIGIQPLHAQESQTSKVNYLALGDSLAAGQTPYGVKQGKGYPDYLAEKLQQANYLGNFEKRYALSGKTSKQLLEDIQNNAIYGDEDVLGIQEQIKKSDLITLDIGANDLFPYIQIINGSFVVDMEGISGTFPQIQANMRNILSEIKALNPQAKLYVMGYYSPHVPDPYQTQLDFFLGILNNTIHQITVENEVFFVPAASAFAQHKQDYLPNPADVHPGETGYRALAAEFWKQWKNDFPLYRVTGEVILNGASPLGTTISLQGNGQTWSRTVCACGEGAYITVPIHRVTSSVYNDRVEYAFDLPFGTYELKAQQGDQSVTTTVYTDPGLGEPFTILDYLIYQHPLEPLTLPKTESGSDDSGSSNGPSGSGPKAEKPVVPIEENIPTPAAFSDTNGHWASDSIAKMVSLNVINGFPDGSFHPNSFVTRAEFITMMAKAWGLEAKKQVYYSDTVDHWAHQAIAAAASHGIIEGDHQGAFHPNAPLSREQMAVILVKLLKLDLQTVSSNLSDQQSISPWALNYVAAAMKHGLMSGYPDGKFQPQASATRAEAVTVLSHIMK